MKHANAKLNAAHTPIHKAVLLLTAGDDFLSIGSTYTGYNVNGLGGNDNIFTSYGNDTVDGGAGNDSIYSPGGNDKLSGGAGNDSVVHGWQGSAMVSGGLGDDTVAGYSGNDTVDGGAGNDLLVLCGRDVATGGTGADTFQFVFTGPPIDGTLTDFKAGQGDKLDIGMLGWWDENGYHAPTASDVEIQGRDLVVHMAYNGDAIIHGGAVALIANAVIFDNGYGGGLG
jgi:serralysin